MSSYIVEATLYIQVSTISRFMLIYIDEVRNVILLSTFFNLNIPRMVKLFLEHFDRQIFLAVFLPHIL